MLHWKANHGKDSPSNPFGSTAAKKKKKALNYVSDIDYKSELGMAVAMKSMQLADASFNRYIKENKKLPNPEEIAKMAKEAKFANAAAEANRKSRNASLASGSPRSSPKSGNSLKSGEVEAHAVGATASISTGSASGA